MRIIQNSLMLAMVILLFAGCATTTDTNNSTQSEKAAELNAQLGANYLRQGNLELADQKLRRALSQNPKSATTNWMYALLQVRLGEDDLADRHFRRAIELDPNDPRAHNNYGAFLCSKDRIREAEKEFLIAIDNPLYKQADSAYVNAGICVLKIPDKPKAEEYFHKAITINPRQRSAIYQLARIHFDRQEYEQTTHYIDKYEKLSEHNSESLWIAYKSSDSLGLDAKAKDYADQLKKQYPASDEARLLAESYWNAGKQQ